MRYDVDRKDLIVQEICRYVEEHLCEELTHGRLQERLGLHRHDLTATFREKTGQTLTQYIIDHRLKSAIGKVEAGMRLEDAAYRSGFRTYSHFYKMFVKYYGISPKEYFSYEKRMEREEK